MGVQGDSAMNPQHIRGHNVNTAISPQYAEGSSALGARPLVALLQQRTRPGVTLSWTSAQGPPRPSLLHKDGKTNVVTGLRKPIRPRTSSRATVMTGREST